MTSLPADAAFVSLRPDALVFATRECLLPGTVVALTLVMEGRRLPLEAPVEACLVVARDKTGYTFHTRIDLAALPAADRQILGLFIAKGRGSAGLERTPAK